jgi:hypothetical protein
LAKGPGFGEQGRPDVITKSAGDREILRGKSLLAEAEPANESERANVRRLHVGFDAVEAERRERVVENEG